MPYRSRFSSAGIASMPNTYGVPEGGGSDWAAGLADAIGGYADFQDIRAQGDYRDAQTRTETLRGESLQRQLDGQSAIAQIFEWMSDPEFARGAGGQLARSAAEAGIDPRKVAGLVQLFTANSPEGAVAGSTNEEVLVRNRAAAGDAPLSPGEAFDVDRSQRNFEMEDATKRYGFDQGYRQGIDEAGIRSMGGIREAEIRSRPQPQSPTTKTTTTTTTGAGAVRRANVSPTQLDEAVQSAVTEVAGVNEAPASVVGRVKRRTETLLSQGAALSAAASQAAREVVQPQNRTIFGFETDHRVRPAVRSNAPPDVSATTPSTTNSSTTTRTVETTGSSSGKGPLRAPAGAPVGGRIEYPIGSNRAFRVHDDGTMSPDGTAR